MSKNPNFYLLENSVDSLQMNQQIKALIETKEFESINLAFRILEAGGVSSDIITYIFALQKWHKNISIRNQAKLLFNQFASNKLKNFITEEWKQSFMFETDESRTSKYLTVLSSFYEINRDDLGNIHLILTERGGKFCIEHQTTSTKLILSKMIKNKELNLSGFHLKHCPREIAEFHQLEILDISNNDFSKLPTEFKHLKRLKLLIYNHSPLKKEHVYNILPHLNTKPSNNSNTPSPITKLIMVN